MSENIERSASLESHPIGQAYLSASRMITGQNPASLEADAEAAPAQLGNLKGGNI